MKPISIALRIVILLIAIIACIYVPWFVGNRFFVVWINGYQEGPSLRISIAEWILGIFLLLFISLIIMWAVSLFSAILPGIIRWTKTGSFSIALISCLFFVGCDYKPTIRQPITGVVINKDIQKRFVNPDSYYIVVKTKTGKQVYDTNASEYLLVNIGDSVTISFDEFNNPYIK